MIIRFHKCEYWDQIEIGIVLDLFNKYLNLNFYLFSITFDWNYI